jgi:hypothetical protein
LLCLKLCINETMGISWNEAHFGDNNPHGCSFYQTTRLRLMIG